MKAKRILAGLLGAAMMCSLAACGSSSGSSDAADDTAVAVSEEVAETEEAAEEPADDEAWDLSEQEITFEETTVIDNEYCKLTVLGVAVDGEVCTLDMKMENRTSDERCYCFPESINGVEGDFYIYNDGAHVLNFNAGAGETRYCEIEIHMGDDWDASVLNWPGYSDIAFKLENGQFDEIEIFHIYPYGEENATVYEPSESAQVLLDNDYITIILLNPEMYESDNAESGVFLYVQNKSDQIIDLKTGGSGLVNGNVVSVGLSNVWQPTDLYPGENYIYTMGSTSWTEHNMDTLESLEMTFEGEDSDTDEVLFKEDVSVTFE